MIRSGIIPALLLLSSPFFYQVHFRVCCDYSWVDIPYSFLREEKVRGVVFRHLKVGSSDPVADTGAKVPFLRTVRIHRTT
ncbi:hypothetical protein [Rhodopirellula sp. SWK7]|uniref:hypothetical protein n=1 Tax=Rhodopirellula sp. SWK7 TaxID=595460 RepID=UPI001181A19A|nr:hypothetical protein [Rhodopirellula sp. SWK7]